MIQYCILVVYRKILYDTMQYEINISYDIYTILHHMVYDPVSNNATVANTLSKIINYDFHIPII